ncbi:hypothetical protein V5799_012693 [Amblyomma americanum]|uniref:Uncharacterized protein n=1 Tax=Amblyomma americanum TaxID=6943 RepID=A0AAQ4E831_AMBAM
MLCYENYGGESYGSAQGGAKWRTTPGNIALQFVFINVTFLWQNVRVDVCRYAMVGSESESGARDHSGLSLSLGAFVVLR